jgi:GT2 family glycosyltransferase
LPALPASATPAPPIPAPSVCVVVVAHNSGAYLGPCIDALAAQSFRDFEAILVDNGSSDGAIERLGPLPPNFRVLRFADNLGFAAANNRAAAATRAPWLALLNPDAVAAPDWLEKLMAAMRRHPDIVMFGSAQVKLGDPGIWDGLGDAYHAAGIPWRGGFGWRVEGTAPEGEVFGPCAAAALYRRDPFLAAGGFDERFFCYVEDVDLAFRLRLMGHRALQVADAVVQHAGSGTAGRATDFTLFHSWRNRSWTFVKNMPAPLFWPLLPAHLAAVAAALAWFWLLPGRRGAIGPRWQGLVAALRGVGPIWRSRRAIQRTRTASLCAIARAMTWWPVGAMRRAPVVRPMPELPSRPSP